MLYTGVGQVSATFKADSSRNLVSAVAKLYPSPDWNVGVDRINLCDRNCTWKPTIVKDLYPWDAGNHDVYFKFSLIAFNRFRWDLYQNNIKLFREICCQ